MQHEIDKKEFDKYYAGIFFREPQIFPPEKYLPELKSDTQSNGEKISFIMRILEEKKNRIMRLFSESYLEDLCEIICKNLNLECSGYCIGLINGIYIEPADMSLQLKDVCDKKKYSNLFFLEQPKKYMPISFKENGQEVVRATYKKGMYFFLI